MATRSKLESLSNIAVIVAAVALCVVLVRNQWPSEQPGSPQALEGSTIDLASLTSAPAKKNLVMVVSQTCHFCEQEMPFYRSLGELKLDGKASLIVVFPPQEKEPAKFLAARSVRADHVVNSPRCPGFRSAARRRCSSWMRRGKWSARGSVRCLKTSTRK
jgi:hypothetical protein